MLGSGAEVQAVGGSGLSLQWGIVQSDDATALPVSFRVLDEGRPATGAEIVIRGVIASDGVELARGMTDSTGAVTLAVPLTEEVLVRGAVMVQARHQGKSATRKLRGKR